MRTETGNGMMMIVAETVSEQNERVEEESVGRRAAVEAGKVGNGKNRKKSSV